MKYVRFTVDRGRGVPAGSDLAYNILYISVK